MPKKLITPEVENQNLITDVLKDDIPSDPKSTRRFFSSNIFQRTLSHLLGFTGTRSKLLKCNSAGILKTVSGPTFVEHNDTKSGNAPDAYGAAISFGSLVSVVDIWIKDNDVVFKRSLDGVAYDDEIPLDKDSFYSFECLTLEFKIKNAVALSVGKYVIVGWK